MTVKITDIGYAAGLFDGEGCITAHMPSGSIRLDIKNTNFKALKYLHKCFGGSIYVEKPNKENGRIKSIGRWALHGEQAVNFLRKIEPMLIIKKEEALLAIKFPINVKKVTPEIIEKRNLIKEAITILKRIPSKPFSIRKNKKIKKSPIIRKAVELYKSGFTTYEIAPLFHVKPETVQIWMRIHKVNRSAKLSKQMKKERIDALDRIRVEPEQMGLFR